MIVQEKKFVIYCNGCLMPYEHNGDYIVMFTDREEAKDALRTALQDEGWRQVKRKHYCEDCAKKMKLK